MFKFRRGDAALITQLAEMNRKLEMTSAGLDGLGAVLNAAASNAARVRRPRPVPSFFHRFGNPAGRTRTEVVAVLNQFGHNLT